MLDNAFADADISFHHVIAQAAGNELLVALTSWTQDVLVPTLVARACAPSSAPTGARRPAPRDPPSGPTSPAGRRRTGDVAEHMRYLEELVLALDPVAGRRLQRAVSTALAEDLIRLVADPRQVNDGESDPGPAILTSGSSGPRTRCRRLSDDAGRGVRDRRAPVDPR